MADANHSDRARLARFWASARGFWSGKSAMIAWPLTIALVVIAISQLFVQYRLNYWNRDFFNALARRDGSAGADRPEHAGKHRGGQHRIDQAERQVDRRIG